MPRIDVDGYSSDDAFERFNLANASWVGLRGRGWHLEDM